VRAASGSAGIHMAGMALTFFSGVQLARGLGASGYGVYGLAMSVVALVAIPTQFGLPPLLTREIAAAGARSELAKVHALIRWSTRAVLAASAGTAALMVLSIACLRPWVDSELIVTLIWGLPLVPLIALGNMRGAALRGLQHVVKGQMPDLLLRPALFSTLLLSFNHAMSRRIESAEAIALHVAAAGMTLLAATLMLNRAKPPASGPRDLSSEELRSLRASALPMALTQGARVLQGHLVILLLGALTAATTVGVFRVASAISLTVATPIALMNVVAAPVFARLHAQGDYTRLRRMLGWVAAVMLGGVGLLTFPFVVGGDYVISLVFGADYLGATQPLLILCAGVALSALMGANSSLLNMTGHEAVVTRGFVVGLACLGISAPPLIWFFHANGAALAQSIGMLAWNVLLWHYAKTRLGLDTSALGLLTASRARRLRGRLP
jgi:O-antigen/teichoic acid export membrane protein